MSNYIKGWVVDLQEYVDHGSCVYKFYVIGNKVFHSCRRSMPNAASLAVSAGNSTAGIPALVFDRLKFKHNLCLCILGLKCHLDEF